MPKIGSTPSIKVGGRVVNGKSKVSSPARKYPPADVKQLFARSTGLCAFPKCSNECLIEKTKNDRHANISIIAHIVAHSDGGPRSNPNMPEGDRDKYENWVLLCPYHHDLVDVQPNEYTCNDLRGWKAEREQWVWSRTREQIPNVGFAELDVVCQTIPHMACSSDSVWDKTLTPPLEKMRKNKLTESTESLLTMGLALAKKVEDFIAKKSRLDFTFPDRLKEGFVQEYNTLLQQGIVGDELFERLRQFASGGSYNFHYQAASLGVLSYLFEQCDIFER